MEWTPIQAKMLNVLSDGKPHTKRELHACLNDDLSPLCNVYAHIKAINDKLKVHEQRVIAESNRYRWVRLVVYSE